MKNILGAQRPASTRNVLWIAVAAIVLVLALATAAFSQAYGGNGNWFGMGSDNVMGMMPPNGMYPPPDGGGGNMRRMPTANCDAARPITIKQSGPHHHTFTYVSTKHACVYTITRDKKAWATVTYDVSSGTYKLTDPSGSGRLILELGIPPGKFPARKIVPIQSEEIIKLTPHPLATR
jgi:hypothetical protein